MARYDTRRSTGLYQSFATVTRAGAVNVTPFSGGPTRHVQSKQVGRTVGSARELEPCVRASGNGSSCAVKNDDQWTHDVSRMRAARCRRARRTPRGGFAPRVSVTRTLSTASGASSAKARNVDSAAGGRRAPRGVPAHRCKVVASASSAASSASRAQQLVHRRAPLEQRREQHAGHERTDHCDGAEGHHERDAVSPLPPSPSRAGHARSVSKGDGRGERIQRVGRHATLGDREQVDSRDVPPVRRRTVRRSSRYDSRIPPGANGPLTGCTTLHGVARVARQSR